MLVTFEAYQAWFKEYDNKRHLTHDKPLESLAHLMEEVGEISRHVLHLEGHKALDDAQRDEERDALALELADAFVFLTKLANAYEIEWSETIKRSMQKAEARWDVNAGQKEAARRQLARER